MKMSCIAIALAMCALFLFRADSVRADDETTYYDNATSLMGQKKYAEAEAEFRKSIHADPRYKEAWQGLADALSAEGKTAQADAARKMAEAAPAARSGPAPQLTDEQKQALGEVGGAPAPAPAAVAPQPPAANDKDAEIAELKRKLAEAEAAKAKGAAPADNAAEAAPAQPAAPGSLKPAAAAPALPPLSVRDAGGKPKAVVKLSKYDGAKYCDLAVGPDGTIHAIYSETPVSGKPNYLYYRASTDGGKTWSEPKNLSDDESGNSVGFSRVIIDGHGRVYAVWKYLGPNGGLIDGPGGNEGGIICFRCLDGGNWSRTIPLNKEKEWGYSFFAAVDPTGVAHVVWSQILPATAQSKWFVAGGASAAGLVQQASLDGDNLGPIKQLIVPPAWQSEEQLKAAGQQPTYEAMHPDQGGIINLRGVVDSAGVAHFIGEPQGKPHRIIHYNGRQVSTVYTYPDFVSENIFNNPPTLLVDAAGVEHVIRRPEKAEKACLRDYSVGDKLSDPIDAIAVNDAKGRIYNFQAWQLPGGRMAITADLSQKGGYTSDDQELYVTFSDGQGKWTPPLCLTDNQYRQNFFAKSTGGDNNIAEAKTYRPDFASVAADKDGHPLVLMVNVEHAVVGISQGALAGSGSAVQVNTGFSTDSPMVFFVKP